MKIYEILEATKGKLLFGNISDDVRGFTHDSREVNQGDLYVPLIGERVDGHKFIDSAFEKGASSIITMQEVNYPDKNVILVEDTLKALADMAIYVRTHHNVKVVGITGSVGKTSTRDMVASVVSKQYKTLKTEGNFNSNVGLPLTILRYLDEEVMVLEMGMNHLKEMEELSLIAKPDIAAITNVGTAHIGELGSREKILEAKMEIIAGMEMNSTLILNRDNDMLQSVTLDDINIIGIGIDQPCSLQAKNVELFENDSCFDLEYQGKSYHVEVPVQGKHFVLNALIAIAIGLELDIDIELCIEGVKDFTLTKNRMDVIELKNHITLIDGTYNASEDSMKSSIDVLANYSRRKIAVLADMLELGSYSKELHESVGSYVKDKQIDIFLAVGKEANYMASAAENKDTTVIRCEDNQEVISYLLDHLQPNDVILLKGSNGMKLKEVVEILKEKLQ